MGFQRAVMNVGNNGAGVYSVLLDLGDDGEEIHGVAMNFRNDGTVIVTNIGSGGVSVRATTMNTRNNFVSVRNAMVTVRNDCGCICCKFDLEAESQNRSHKIGQGAR